MTFWIRRRKKDGSMATYAVEGLGLYATILVLLVGLVLMVLLS